HLVEHPDFTKLSTEQQAAVQHFIENGYLILKGFFKDEEVDQLNQEVDNMLKEQELKFNYSGRKILDAFRYSQVADEAFFRNQALLRFLNFIMGKKVVPFQTLNFIKGSEQSAHSDSIHMCTHPFGYLIAAWIALEDIQEGTGELFYYPGSHRLPFVSAEDYDSGNSYWRIGKESNKKYEEKMREVLAKNIFPKEVFLAKKGDVLLWHANLIHGGSPITNPEGTRRSMVAHYYCEDVICYHEMTQRPALITS
ncbi:MAG: phytanoyl-CoA dioxygenase family protein, partial [Bacteroidota bacterium]